jgi:tRNA(Ile)-lysidine synthase
MSRNVGSRTYRAFEAAVRMSGMIVPGDRVLAACSGGADSVVLVSLLLKLRDAMTIEIAVAHFNHGLREAAAADESLVRAIARKWALPFFPGSKDVRAQARRRGLNLEEAARLLRYGFLRNAAGAWGATKIATGHTMNDQAETFLMRLFRGTGLSGLAGIGPVSGDDACPVVRPLLGIGRREIEAYARAEGLAFREDESNADRRYLRNRIRLDLLPQLARDYEPRIVEHLARLAFLLREEDALLGGFIRELTDEFISGEAKRATLDVRTLSLVPPALARRVAREFLRRLKGDLRAFSFDDVESLLDLKDGKEKTVKKGLCLRREQGRLFLKSGRRAVRAFDRAWDGRGELNVAGWQFRGKTMARPGSVALRGDDRKRAVLDLAKLRFPLVVRGRRPGDLYRPLGAPGRKKLNELLRSRGIHGEEKDRLPVFLSRGEIVWAPGLPVGERFKVEGSTTSLFLIETKKTRAGGRQRR